MTATFTRRQVHYLAQECRWQRSGELSVSWMADALTYALKHRNELPTLEHVLKLGALVEPEVNGHGFRHTQVWVDDDEKLAWHEIESEMARLIASTVTCPMSDEDASDWFKRYEDIHPFRDGNGRTGSLIFNWLRRSLEAPIHPPNLWDDGRRDLAGYPQPLEIVRKRYKRAET